MDTSFDEWLTLDDIPECQPNYCDEENGIFWGEYTETERQYVAKLAEGLATRSTDSTIIVSQTDDHSIYDGMVPKEYSIVSSIEPMNISENMSPFVSSFGSSLVSKDSPLLKTPIVEKISDETIGTEVTTDSRLFRTPKTQSKCLAISDSHEDSTDLNQTPNYINKSHSEAERQYVTEGLATHSADSTIIVSQTDDHSIYDEMIPKEYSIISSIEPMNNSENMSPFVSSFGSSLVSKDSPLLKTPIVEKLSDETIGAEVTTDSGILRTPKTQSKCLVISDSHENSTDLNQTPNYINKSHSETEPQYVTEELATRSADSTIIVSETDDHSIYDEMIPKEYSIVSSETPKTKSKASISISNKSIGADLTIGSNKTFEAFFKTPKTQSKCLSINSDVYDMSTDLIETSNIDKSRLKTPKTDSKSGISFSNKTIGADVTIDSDKTFENLFKTPKTQSKCLSINSDVYDMSSDLTQTSNVVNKSYLKTPKTNTKTETDFSNKTIGAEVTIDCEVNDGFDSSNIDFDNLVEMEDNLITDESTLHINDSINICTNEDQIQSYCLKPSHETSNTLDQTIEMTKFESTIIDNSIEVNAKDLLSPFPSNKSGRTSGESVEKTKTLTLTPINKSFDRRLSYKSMSFHLEDLEEEEEEEMQTEKEDSILTVGKASMIFSQQLSPIFESNDSQNESNSSQNLSKDLAYDLSTDPIDELNSTFTISDKTCDVKELEFNDSVGTPEQLIKCSRRETRSFSNKTINSEVFTNDSHKTSDNSLKTPKIQSKCLPNNSDSYVSTDLNQTSNIKNKSYSQTPKTNSKASISISNKTIGADLTIDSNKTFEALFKTPKTQSKCLSINSDVYDMSNDLKQTSNIDKIRLKTPKTDSKAVVSFSNKTIGADVTTDSNKTFSALFKTPKTQSKCLSINSDVYERSTDLNQTSNIKNKSHLKTPKTDSKSVVSFSNKTIGADVTTDSNKTFSPLFKTPKTQLKSLPNNRSVYDMSYDLTQTSNIVNKSCLKTPKTDTKTAKSSSNETIGSEMIIDCGVSDGIDSSNVDFDNLVEMKDNLSTDEFNLLMNDTINIYTNEQQMQNYCLKPSQEKHILDQTIEMTKFESTSIFDNSIEMNAKDLLSPFCLNKNPVKSSAKSSAQEIPVTSSLVSLDTPTVRPLRRPTVGKVESSLKSRIPKLRFNPLQTRRQTRSSPQFNSSVNDSTLDFILNEIKCNTEDTEEFLTIE